MNTQRFGGTHLKTAGALLAFVLVCVFAVLSVLIVAIAIQAYDQIISNAEADGQLRMSLSYTANKIRAHDGLGTIEAKQEGNIDVLALYQTIDGEEYVTYIYCDHGMLLECFTTADSAFDPDMGEELMPLQSFSATVYANRVEQAFIGPDGMPYTQTTAIFAP